MSQAWIIRSKATERFVSVTHGTRVERSYHTRSHPARVFYSRAEAAALCQPWERPEPFIIPKKSIQARRRAA
ncbi:hypothetical protein [Aquibium microcysteis]|uniref:hypothetical protein n=1 Tax=Aquibium microcysteis TaxID=675281 RepID=UPI00165D128F|nr:hypothetical protein [Aquibium microcysteis]